MCHVVCIWHTRNEVLHGIPLHKPSSQAEYALNYIDKYSNAKRDLCTKLQYQKNASRTTQQQHNSVCTTKDATNQLHQRISTLSRGYCQNKNAPSTQRCNSHQEESQNQPFTASMRD